MFQPFLAKAGVGALKLGLGAATSASLALLVNKSSLHAAERGIAVVMQDHLLEAAKIIDVAQLQRVVHYSEWPIIPQWIRTALKLGAGSLLFWAALKWLFSRKMMAGFRRTMKFYGIGLPVAVRYRLKSMMFDYRKTPQEEREAEYAKMHALYAPQVKKVILELGGVYVKVGQVLSTRSDLLPKQWADELRDTLSNITPCPVQDIVTVIEEDLGCKLTDKFSSFDVSPIAAASLAQVHHGRLRDGRAVVVKVQYPDIERVMMSDLNAVCNISRIVQPGMHEAELEMKNRIAEEFDFINEAKNLTLIREKLSGRDDVVVPEPIFATKRVLIMTFVEGDNLATVLSRGAPVDPAVFRTMIDVTGEQMIRHGVFNGDPHPGNFIVMPDNRVGLVDFGQLQVIDDERRLRFARLVKALAVRDEKEVFNALYEFGYRTKHNHEHSFFVFAAMNLDNQSAAVGMSLMEIMQVMQTDPLVYFPKSLLFLLRSTMLLRGATNGAPFVMSQMWSAYADAALQEQGQQGSEQPTSA